MEPFNHIQAKYASHAYRSSFIRLYNTGDEVEVRGRKTRELLNFVTDIADPTQRVIRVPGRRWNPFIALSEILWFFSGRNDIAPLLPFNKRIAEFSDDGKTLNGSAYGWRLYSQIEPAISRLKADSADRRAVLTIWNESDLMAETKDAPCNDMIMLKVRQGKLHFTVLNRSNDIHWGLYAVNFPVFSALMEYIATRLGAEIGTYTHFSNSLHFYEDHEQAAGITKRIWDQRMTPVTAPKVLDKPIFEPRYMEQQYVTEEASLALEGEYTTNFRFFHFAGQALDFARVGHWADPYYSDLYPNWAAACREWMLGSPL